MPISANWSGSASGWRRNCSSGLPRHPSAVAYQHEMRTTQALRCGQRHQLAKARIRLASRLLRRGSGCLYLLQQLISLLVVAIIASVLCPLPAVVHKRTGAAPLSTVTAAVGISGRPDWHSPDTRVDQEGTDDRYRR